jgi:hypothetical protein
MIQGRCVVVYKSYRHCLNLRKIPNVLPQLNANCGSTLVASLVWPYQKQSISQPMERVNEDQSLPRKAPRLVYPPVLEKKSPKPKPVLEYHLIEQKITSAITDFKAGKYTSLAEAGRAHGVTERAGRYARVRIVQLKSH